MSTDGSFQTQDFTIEQRLSKDHEVENMVDTDFIEDS